MPDTDTGQEARLRSVRRELLSRAAQGASIRQTVVAEIAILEGCTTDEVEWVLDGLSVNGQLHFDGVGYSASQPEMTRSFAGK